MTDTLRKPDWLKIRLHTNENFGHINKLIDHKNLNTVCVEAACPNIHECWSAGTATFMILGDTCSRSCRFCNVKTGRSDWIDPDEPKRVALSVKDLKLKHAVVTSVNRDELRNGGAEIFAGVVDEIRKEVPGCSVELLIPDFKGNRDALKIVIDSQPEILAHNVETIPRLYKEVRPQADYRQTLNVIKTISDAGLISKCSVMLGLGETFDEVIEVMRDLREVNCHIFTLGQYLRPTKQHHEVKRYVHPDEFQRYATIGHEMGFDHVESGPLVRSSYHAEKQANLQAKGQ